jgi:sugar transferase (PEP-CTERM/EpsH1 system associated)
MEESADVLFLAHRAPFPPDKGDRLRAWRHLQALARVGPVDLLALADDEDDARAARAGLAGTCREVHVFARRRPLAALRAGAALLAGVSLTLAWQRDGRASAALRGLQARHAYRMLWAFSSGTAGWWDAATCPRRIMDLCDLDALKWEALARRGGPRALAWRAEARRLLPIELRLAAEADAVLLISPQEASDLRERGGRPRRLELLTNGVDAAAFAGLPPPSAAGPVLAFLGQMDYPPNVAAALSLAREVLPRVRARVPGARLLVLGRAPSPAVRALARPGEVEVTGALDDVPAALGRAAVFCAPLDEGRGLPNKALEALAAGRATVLSSWAARALAGEPGRHYLVADGAEARADAVAGLLLDPVRADALGAAGRQWVALAHDWAEVKARVERLAREVLARA